MANQIFKVRDTQLGTDTLVNAASARKAEKFMEKGRFVATKATPQDITEVVNGGGKILEAVDPMGESDAAPAEVPPQAENAAPDAAVPSPEAQEAASAIIGSEQSL